MFQEEGGFVWGFREGRGDLSLGLSQPGGKICWAVWRSGLWCSGTVFLMVGAVRDCVKDGWGPSRYYWLCWSIVYGKYPGWRGEEHRWFLQLCSLSAGGSCGLLHYSSRTRQWCSCSAHSQWFPCRRWWGWVEGDFSFTFMHLADTFIQSDLQFKLYFFIIMCVPSELNPQPFALLTQCSTTEPQEHLPLTWCWWSRWGPLWCAPPGI